MSTATREPVLLRRIARLEATVDRLAGDLGAMRAELQQARPQRALAPAAADADRPEPSPFTPATGGLAAARARGEAARVQWVRDGLVIPGAQLANAWGLTRQALAAAAGRGELFSVKVGRRLFYPQAFEPLDRDTVAQVCRALGALGSSEKLMFWLHPHGTLQGASVPAALAAGTEPARIARLARAWARERGVVGHGPAAT